MRIMLSGADFEITDPLRAYAEYRLFRSVARHEPLVTAVDIAVRQYESERDRFLCTVAVALRPAGRIRTQARGPHPGAAIDRAADRTAWLLDRRAQQPVSS